MRSARGQGTVEYLAVVLLVAVVAGGAGTAVAGGAGADIATAVPRQIIRALCIVRGGDCDRDRAPCDIASNARSTSWAVAIAVFRFGHDKTVTVTERSDGKFVVTLDTAPIGGLETTVGGRVKLSLGHRTIAAGADLTAGVTGSWAHGRTWVMSTSDDADRLVVAIRDDASLPPPDQEGREGTLEAGLQADAGRAVAVSGAASAMLRGGWQTDRATGNRTFFFATAVAGDAQVAANGSDAAASVAGQDGDRYALTMDRHGRWLDLALTRAGALSSGADLPHELAPVAHALDVPTTLGRSWVTETHLDLTDAANLAVARGALSQAPDSRHPRAFVDALRALSRRVGAQGVIHARTYAVDTSTFGIEGHGGVELKLGGKYERTTDKTRLVAAATRGIDGRWRRRTDCLQEVAA
jgi:hypothetical protein